MIFVLHKTHGRFVNERLQISANKILSDAITEQREGDNMVAALIKDLNYMQENTRSVHVHSNFARQTHFLTDLVVCVCR
jgi:hypothetical protein